MRSRALLLVAMAMLLVSMGVVPGNMIRVSAFEPHKESEWTVTERLRELNGQDHFSYSTHFDTLDRYVAVGSITENMERGLVKIYHDQGRGLLLEKTLTDSDGVIHDEYGAFVRLFVSFESYHVAVSAPGKSDDGAVMVYKEQDGEWNFQQTLYPPVVGEYVTRFGRSTHYDGTQLLVSAISRYITSDRFEVGALNVKGTRYFYEADGVGELPTDPIYVFASKEGRRNTTSLSLATTLRDGPYTSDFGLSISLSGTRMAVGAPFRKEIVYGHGNDGDLTVKAGEIKLLDGAATYNFANVYIEDGGVLKVDPYETIRGYGGILHLKILNELHIAEGGLVNLSAIGFEAGPTAFQATGGPTAGKGPGAGYPATSEFTGVNSCDHDGSTTVNVETSVEEQTAGVQRSNSTLAFAEANGGGGSYGTAGLAGTGVQCGISGVSGATYGDEFVTEIYRGSGGGAGFPWSVGSGGAGGAGGGVVNIAARVVTNYGRIESRGGNAEAGGYYSGGGGGGAGGSIVLLGTELANYGTIDARGGFGGQRASGTGFGGDVEVVGGDGGDGRIHFDFLTTRSIGHVWPHPKNVTTFYGDVYLYEKTVANGNQWLFTTTVPRLSGMMFIGHQVSLDGTMLAVASDEGTDVQPTQAVYLMSIAGVMNLTSPIYNERIFNPPDATTDRHFGYKMEINNNTLIIGAYGSSEYAGVVYLHMGRNLYQESETQMITLRTEKPAAGDYYGQNIAFAYPELLLQLPYSHDDNVEVTERLTIGEVHLWKHVRNISHEHSSVHCDYTVITANTTMNCTVRTFDKYGFAAGDLIDLVYFNEPAVLDFKLIGAYSFQWRPDSLGTQEVHSSYKGKRIKSFFVSVTPHIIAHLTNLTCSPASADAGQEITCTIHTNAEAGELNAKTYFDVFAYNLNDVELVTTTTATSLGRFITPKSNFISVDPYTWDFNTKTPSVDYVRHGVYEFKYTPDRPGSWAAYVNYMQEPLQYPNPSIIDALDTQVHTQYSTLSCPSLAAPNRTMYCTIQLRGTNNLPTNALLYSNLTHTGKGILDGNTYAATPVWANEGRIALLIQPDAEGLMSVYAPIGMDNIKGSPATVDVRYLYTQQCNEATRVFNSWTILNQHTQGRADEVQYGVVATRAAILDGQGLCDDPRV